MVTKPTEDLPLINKVVAGMIRLSAGAVQRSSKHRLGAMVGQRFPSRYQKRVSDYFRKLAVELGRTMIDRLLGSVESRRLYLPIPDCGGNWRRRLVQT